MSAKPDDNFSVTSEQNVGASPVNTPKGSVSRRDFIKTTAVAGAATAVSSFPYIRAKAADTGSIKFGLLEDRSGNFAIFGLNKWHGTQLAIKEINDGWTLDGGVQGPGGPGVFAKTAEHAPTENIKDVVERGGDETVDATVWKQGDEYLVQSGEKGVLGRPIELIAPDPQSDNTQFQTLSRRLILEDKVDVVMAGFASAEREAIRPIMYQNKMLYFYNNQYEGGVADKYTFCTGAIPDQRLVLFDQIPQVVFSEICVGRSARRHALRLQQMFEVVHRYAKHHARVHLDEPSVRVVGKPCVLALVSQCHHGSIVESEVENRFHHARHRDRRARSHRDEKRIFCVAEFLAGNFFEPRYVAFDFGAESVGVLTASQVLDAFAAGDGKARRNGNAQIRHLGEVRALAAEDVRHVERSLGSSVAEEEDRLSHEPR